MKTDEVIELKPCPFCGGEAQTLSSYSGFVTTCIACPNKDAIEKCGENVEDSQIAWNTRTKPDRAALVEEVERLREFKAQVEERTQRIDDYIFMSDHMQMMGIERLIKEYDKQALTRIDETQEGE